MAPHLSSPSHKDADDTTWDSEAFHKMSFNDSSRNPSFLSRIPWLRQSSAGRHGDSSKLAALEDTLPEYTHGIIRFLSTRAFAWICFGLMSLSFFLAQLSHNSSPSPSASLANLNTTLLSNATTSLNDTSIWPPDRRGDLSNTQNVAYLTMFTETVKVQEGETDYSYEDDIYFIGLRMLTYQLVHAPETRTRRNIPFIIMVTADVSMSKREQLEKDGAIISPVATITDGFDWINPGGKQVRWRDQLTKLHAWELVQYERILYIDGDMILMRCMDGIFDADQTNNTAVATRNDTAQIHADEAPMPEEYLIASMPETWWEYYSYPPNHSDITMGTDYINGGFILFKPDPVMFEYYLSGKSFTLETVLTLFRNVTAERRPNNSGESKGPIQPDLHGTIAAQLRAPHRGQHALPHPAHDVEQHPGQPGGRRRTSGQHSRQVVGSSCCT